MAKPDILIRGGLIIDPVAGTEVEGDLLIRGGALSQAGGSVETTEADGRTVLADGTPLTVVDATGCWVTPAFVDLHTHFREPGREDQETVLTGAAAALAGGFAAAAVMANTTPCNDNRTVTEYILDKARAAAPFTVLPVGAITNGREGKVLAEMADLADAGCVAFSDDGRWTMDAGVFRRALEYARGLGLPLLVHAEDLTLAHGGVMHQGPVATRLGLPGLPAAAETVAVARDLELVAAFPHRVHFQHLSLAASAAMVRRARAAGLPVTAEAAPHHLLLTDDLLASYDTRFKMNPPLRPETDRQALIAAINDGTIQAIATDHAPWTVAEKEGTLLEGPFGVIGLETAASVVVELILDGELNRMAAIRALTTGPAAILGVPLGRLAVGTTAGVTVIDPRETWIPEGATMVSKSANTPFEGRVMTGKVVATMIGGLLSLSR
jgi:dihydroorotase